MVHGQWASGQKRKEHENKISEKPLQEDIRKRGSRVETLTTIHTPLKQKKKNIILYVLLLQRRTK